MSSLACSRVALVLIWLCAQVAGCAKGDVSLGEHAFGAAPSAPAAGMVSVEVPARNDAGTSVPGVPTGAAADSGSAVQTQAPDAGMMAPDASASQRDDDAGSAVPSAGCGRMPSTLNTSVAVDGMRADFLLDTPTSYDPSRAYPLVLAFRGMDQSAAEFRARLQLATVMGSEAIVVHANPVANGASWDFQRDIRMVDALVSTLGAAYCVDQDRVFAIGDSAGALFVNLIGCVRADKVRGIAVLSNAPPPPGPCLDYTAVWLLQQTDTDPMTVGAGLGNRDFWAARNACNVLMPTSIIPAGCVEYAGCSDHQPVHFCEQDGDALPSFAVSAAWAFFRSL
jgi:poly(3-hydroxybutyrate) depolymerase